VFLAASIVIAMVVALVVAVVAIGAVEGLVVRSVGVGVVTLLLFVVIVLVMIRFAVAVMNVAEGVVRVVIIGVVALVEVVVAIVEVLPLLPVVVVLIVLVELVVVLVVMIFGAVLGVPVVEGEGTAVASVDVIVVVNVAIIVVAVALVLIVVAVVVDEVVVVVAEVVVVILVVNLEAKSEHSGHAAQSLLENAHLLCQSWRFMAHQRSHRAESFRGVVSGHAGHLSHRPNQEHLFSQLFLFCPHHFGQFAVLASAGVQIEMIIAITVNKSRCDR